MFSFCHLQTQKKRRWNNSWKCFLLFISPQCCGLFGWENPLEAVTFSHLWAEWLRWDRKSRSVHFYKIKEKIWIPGTKDLSEDRETQWEEKEERGLDRASFTCWHLAVLSVLVTVWHLPNPHSRSPQLPPPRLSWLADRPVSPVTDLGPVQARSRCRL